MVMLEFQNSLSLRGVIFFIAKIIALVIIVIIAIDNFRQSFTYCKVFRMTLE